MPWHPSLTHLRDALAALYREQGDIWRVVDESGLDGRRIAIYTKALNTWQAILRDAGDQEQLAPRSSPITKSTRRWVTT